MTFLIAADAFKDAQTAPAVCAAIARGIRRADPSSIVIEFPMADGGEGTASVLFHHLGGQLIELTVADPLFRPVAAKYLLADKGRLAFIEMAEASGLQRLAPAERNPLETSTFGTGELILDALNRGAQKILLAIGGSATNDLGMGMAAALGWRFFSKNGREVAPAGKNLIKVCALEPPSVKLPFARIEVICDVDNPLLGERGAAHVYAPQKGATPPAIAALEEGAQHFAALLESHFEKNFADVPGAGAAGGLGAGAMAFLGARLRPGIETVMELTDFEEVMKKADLVFTGEGRLDGQSLHGKLVHGIARKAAKFSVPVIALCGSVEGSPAMLEGIGLTAAFSIQTMPMSLEESIAATSTGLETAAFNVVRALQAGVRQ